MLLALAAREKFFIRAGLGRRLPVLAWQNCVSAPVPPVHRSSARILCCRSLTGKHVAQARPLRLWSRLSGSLRYKLAQLHANRACLPSTRSKRMLRQFSDSRSICLQGCEAVCGYLSTLLSVQTASCALARGREHHLRRHSEVSRWIRRRASIRQFYRLIIGTDSL